MKLPVDAPEWLEPVIASMQERATDLVCNGPSSERGAGYMRAVEDFKVEIENQAEAQRQKALKTFRQVARVRG